MKTEQKKKKKNRNVQTTGIQEIMLALLWQSLLFQTTPAEIKKKKKKKKWSKLPYS